MFDSFGFPFAATQIMWVGAIAHMCYGMKKVAHWSETTSNGVWVQFWRLVGRHAEIYSLMHSKKNICGFCLSWFSDVGSRTIFFNANHVESIDAYNGWPVKYFEYWRNVSVQLFFKIDSYQINECILYTCITWFVVPKCTDYFFWRKRTNVN